MSAELSVPGDATSYCVHGVPEFACPLHDKGVAPGDEGIADGTPEPTEREIMLQVLDELRACKEAINTGNTVLNWLAENTSQAFGFIAQIQANGGPAALLGSMMGGSKNG